MERLTEKITNKENGQVLAYRVPANKTIKAAKKLGELEDLEEKGLLLKLPCKPGDTVYRISDYSSYVTSCQAPKGKHEQIELLERGKVSGISI